MLEFFPELLVCLDDSNLTLTLSWLPFIAASRRAFRAGEEAIIFLKTDEYWGPICMRFCKAKSCKFLIIEGADARAFSSKRKEMRIGRRQATSWEPRKSTNKQVQNMNFYPTRLPKSSNYTLFPREKTVPPLSSVKLILNNINTLDFQ